MASKTTAPAPADNSPVRTFRDTRFTSRSLFLPDGRCLLVARGQVSVQPDDTAALEYLEQHADMQRE